jgi:hypothetical protein
MNKKYFFGWSNIKWFIKQLIFLGTSKPSFFSKKRIESGIAFLIAQLGMVYFLTKNIQNMDTYDICVWAATEFAVAGYIISHIQKEKATQQSGSEEIKTPED